MRARVRALNAGLNRMRQLYEWRHPGRGALMRNLEFQLRTGDRSGQSTKELRYRVISVLQRAKSENKN